MSFISESPIWSNGIYKIEITDPVIGGSNGIPNNQARDLANRTLYLKNLIDANRRYAVYLDANDIIQEQPSPLLPQGRLIMLQSNLGALVTSNTSSGDRAVELPGISNDIYPIGSAIDFINYSDYSSGPGNDLTIYVKHTPTGPSGDTIIDPTVGISLKKVKIPHGGTLSMVKKAVGLWMVIQRESSDLVGEIVMSASINVPYGFLPCNGQVVEKLKYKRLYANIGDTYEDPSNVTDSLNFRLPDVRAQFPRFFDDGLGLDENRILGSKQTEEHGKHKHPANSITLTGAGNGPDLGFVVSNGTSVSQIETEFNGSIGDENRPKNIAFRGLIRY